MEHLGYQIVPKTADTLATRQAVQDRYSSIAQLSQFVAIFAILCYELTFSAFAHFPPNAGGIFKNLSSSRLRSLQSRDMRKAWLVVLAWAAWLGFLCVAETGPGKKYPEEASKEIRADTLQTTCS